MSAIEWDYHPPLRPPEVPSLAARINPVSDELTLYDEDATGLDRMSRWLTAAVDDVANLEEWR